MRETEGGVRVELERIEAIEAELDRIAESRSRERKDANAVEELWRESTERHNEQRRRELSAEWYAHHVSLSDVHRKLAEEHGEKALSLLNGGHRATPVGGEGA
jgi:hypothetical protein